ncbi:MAG: hypothetical protein CMJ78_14465 [Planctomycetaceae bacterium]|nr:hypothetical protein [Planctomycetaceae bacterium]
MSDQSLAHASGYDDDEIVRQLENSIQPDAMINPDTPDASWGTVETRFDPIHSAARMRDVETVKQELEAGVDVDALNGRATNGDGGNTALWFAAQGPSPGGLEVARLLIAAGAEVNRHCEHGRTALQMAAAWGHLDLVQFLIENGADPTIRDDEGMTPAMIASNSKRVPEAHLKPVVDYLNALS